MFDQLISGLKDQAISKLTGEVGMNPDQAEKAFPLAGESVQEGIMGAMTGGQGGLTDLLSMATGGGNSSGIMNNPIVQGIAGNFIGKLTNNLNMDSGLAQNAASTLLPMLLSKIGGAAQENGESNGIGLDDITAILGGGNSGGIMGAAKGLLGMFGK